MVAYVCVYRHPRPSPGDLVLARGNASANPILAQFVTSYDEQGNFYDWGDDPGFFCASHFLGDCRLAGWGVCRPDVRAALAPGDFVAFFCARWAPERVWQYYYIGVATMKQGVSRSDIWTDPRLAAYRNFYNVLARLEDGKLVQHEAMTRHDGQRPLRRAGGGQAASKSHRRRHRRRRPHRGF